MSTPKSAWSSSARSGVRKCRAVPGARNDAVLREARRAEGSSPGTRSPRIARATSRTRAAPPAPDRLDPGARHQVIRVGENGAAVPRPQQVEGHALTAPRVPTGRSTGSDPGAAWRASPRGRLGVACGSGTNRCEVQLDRSAARVPAESRSDRCRPGATATRTRRSRSRRRGTPRRRRWPSAAASRRSRRTRRRGTRRAGSFPRCPARAAGSSRPARACRSSGSRRRPRWSETAGGRSRSRRAPAAEAEPRPASPAGRWRCSAAVSRGPRTARFTSPD